MVAEGKNWRKLSMNHRDHIFGGKLDGLGIRRTADEACEQNGALRCAIEKERRIPDGAKRAQAFGTWDEKAKASERMSYILLLVSERNGDEGSVFDVCKGRGNFRLKELRGNMGWHRENNSTRARFDWRFRDL